MTKEHEQAIKNLESFIDHFHTNIKQAEKANDNAFGREQAKHDIKDFQIAIQAIKDLEKYREPYAKGWNDGAKAVMTNAELNIDEVLDEIKEEIISAKIPPISEVKVMKIIDKYRKG